MRINTRTGPRSEVPITAPVWWIAGVALAIALLAQIEVLHAFSLRGATVSAVLFIVVWYALHSDVRGAAVFGLVAGLCEDAFSAQTGAGWTISTTITAMFVNALTRWFFADSIPVVAAVIVFATLFRRMLFWTVMALQGYPAGYAGIHLHEALWEALLNAAFAIVAMVVLRRFEDRTAR